MNEWLLLTGLLLLLKRKSLSKEDIYKLSKDYSPYVPDLAFPVEYYQKGVGYHTDTHPKNLKYSYMPYNPKSSKKSIIYSKFTDFFPDYNSNYYRILTHEPKFKHACKLLRSVRTKNIKLPLTLATVSKYIAPDFDSYIELVKKEKEKLLKMHKKGIDWPFLIPYHPTFAIIHAVMSYTHQPGYLSSFTDLQLTFFIRNMFEQFHSYPLISELLNKIEVLHKYIKYVKDEQKDIIKDLYKTIKEVACIKAYVINYFNKMLHEESASVFSKTVTLTIALAIFHEIYDIDDSLKFDNFILHASDFIIIPSSIVVNDYNDKYNEIKQKLQKTWYEKFLETITFHIVNVKKKIDINSLTVSTTYENLDKLKNVLFTTKSILMEIL